jgi:hypothetical protein
MKTPLATLAALACAVSYTQAQTLFSDDFNSQTVGNSVSGWTALSPTSATASRGAVIVNSGVGDNSLRIYDTDTSNATRVEQDFLSRSDVHLSLSFRRNADIAVDSSAASTTAFYVTIGANGLAQNTQANRDLEFRLFSNGQYRINRGTQDGGGNFVATSLTTAANFESAGPTFNWHTLDIFMYDGTPGGATKAFVGPDSVARILDPNSFAVFIDGSFITPSSGATANGDFGIFQSSIYGTDNNFGRLGLITGGAANLSGFDYVVDNVVVSGISAVPEPSTLALLGLGALAFPLLRRRNR